MTSPGPRVAVVGCGIIGAMAAWRLAARGADVVVFDAFRPPHDRGASAGESRIFRTVAKEGAFYVPLLRRSEGLWRQLEAESGRRVLTVTGGLTLGPADHLDLLAVRKVAETCGLPYELLDRDDAARRFPQHRLDADEVAFLDPDAGVLRPEVAVLAAVERAVADGARLVPYAPVREIAARGGGWRVTGGETRADVDHVVVTPGPWAPGLDLPWTPPVTARLITACWFAARDPGAHGPDRLPVAVRRHRDAGFSCFPVLDGVSVKIVPHHLGWPELASPEALPRTADPEYVRSAATAAGLLPGVHPTPMRVGTYAEGFTPDGHPLVGALPGAPGITLLTGFSGHGFKLSPVYGEIAADLACAGETAHRIGDLDPARFT